MAKLRIGIIGNGYIGGVHGRLFSADDRVTVSAVYDIIPERTQIAASVLSARACNSREEFLDNCDAVIICTPNRTHFEIASDSVAAGKHVFCEKPFAIGIDEAAKLRDIANAGSGVFQVGHNRRSAPVYQKLRELIISDKPHSAHIKMNRGELKVPAWTGDTAVTGGFLYETTIHLFDMLRYQFGEIAELIAYGSQHEYPELDEFSILFKLQNGFHCTFASSSDASWIFPFERIETFLHHRTIITEEMERLFDSRSMNANYETHSFHMIEKDERWGYLASDRAFVDSILTGAPAVVTADDGYQAVKIVESVYRSIETGEKYIIQR